jgi:hypothetical protein
MALAELLGAHARPPGDPESTVHLAPGEADSTALQVPLPEGGTVILDRPHEPITPAEAARAHRLADVARASLVARNQM